MMKSKYTNFTNGTWVIKFARLVGVPVLGLHLKEDKTWKTKISSNMRQNHDQAPRSAILATLNGDMTKYNTFSFGKFWRDPTKYNKIWQDMPRYDRVLPHCAPWAGLGEGSGAGWPGQLHLGAPKFSSIIAKIIPVIIIIASSSPSLSSSLFQSWSSSSSSSSQSPSSWS